MHDCSSEYYTFFAFFFAASSSASVPSAKAADWHIILCLFRIGLWGILNCKRAELKAAEWQIVLCLFCIGLWGILNCKRADLSWCQGLLAHAGDLPRHDEIEPVNLGEFSLRGCCCAMAHRSVVSRHPGRNAGNGVALLAPYIDLSGPDNPCAGCRGAS